MNGKKTLLLFLLLSMTAVLPASATAEGYPSSVTETAKLYEGTAYTWGGEDPVIGFDCSGFIYYVFSSCGYTVSRTASGQNTDGLGIGLSQIQPGDVVVFGSGSSATHTALYLGDGIIIHALNEANGVICSSLSEYPESVIGVRRIA